MAQLNEMSSEALKALHFDEQLRRDQAQHNMNIILQELQRRQMEAQKSQPQDNSKKLGKGKEATKPASED